MYGSPKEENYTLSKRVGKGLWRMIHKSSSAKGIPGRKTGICKDTVIGKAYYIWKK